MHPFVPRPSTKLEAVRPIAKGLNFNPQFEELIFHPYLKFSPPFEGSSCLKLPYGTKHASRQREWLYVASTTYIANHHTAWQGTQFWASTHKRHVCFCFLFFSFWFVSFHTIFFHSNFSISFFLPSYAYYILLSLFPFCSFHSSFNCFLSRFSIHSFLLFFLFFPFFFHVKFYIYDVSFHSFFCYTYLLYSIVSILEFLHFNSFYYSFFLINSFVMSWFIFLYIFVRPS